MMYDRKYQVIKGLFETSLQWNEWLLWAVVDTIIQAWKDHCSACAFRFIVTLKITVGTFEALVQQFIQNGIFFLLSLIAFDTLMCLSNYLTTALLSRCEWQTWSNQLCLVGDTCLHSSSSSLTRGSFCIRSVQEFKLLGLLQPNMLGLQYI